MLSILWDFLTPAMNFTSTKVSTTCLSTSSRAAIQKGLNLGQSLYEFYCCTICQCIM